MSVKRKELHSLLLSLFENRNVYYQPPENIKLSYPCIVYTKSNIRNNFADNKGYMQKIAYRITVIDRDPDNDIILKLLNTEGIYCTYSNNFISDNLYHDVLTLYF